MMSPKKQKIFAIKVLGILNNKPMLEFKKSIEEFHTILETKIEPDFKEINLVGEIDLFIEKLSLLENNIKDYLGSNKNFNISLATKLYKLHEQIDEKNIDILD